jgi:hypothetical protein
MTAKAIIGIAAVALVIAAIVIMQLKNKKSD